MHRQTGSVSTVIVEYGFVDNAACAARVKDNWRAYAEGVVKAFCEFIKHSYTPPLAVTPAVPEATPRADLHAVTIISASPLASCATAEPVRLCVRSVTRLECQSDGTRTQKL